MIRVITLEALDQKVENVDQKIVALEDFDKKIENIDQKIVALEDFDKKVVRPSGSTMAGRQTFSEASNFES